MSKPKVYIDGKEGTTGLQIYERLGSRDDIELLLIDEDKRKDTEERRRLINLADIVFLCLPDAAAVEAVALCDNDTTRFIDASTAHRTAPGWDYGFAELSPAHRAAIAQSKRVANPGCHASGFIALVQPLVKAGLIAPDTSLSCFSVTGYSGGGKKMIGEYEAHDRPETFNSPRQYGLSQQHKHLAEMVKLCGLETAPVFCPIVADYYSGMCVTVPLFGKDLRGSVSDITALYREMYCGRIVHYDENADEAGLLAANVMSGRDDMQITVCGNGDRILLVSRFDNLGKGASGAAIQNMNIILGVDETTGLEL